MPRASNHNITHQQLGKRWNSHPGRYLMSRCSSDDQAVRSQIASQATWHQRPLSSSPTCSSSLEAPVTTLTRQKELARMPLSTSVAHQQQLLPMSFLISADRQGNHKTRATYMTYWLRSILNYLSLDQQIRVKGLWFRPLYRRPRPIKNRPLLWLPEILS